MRKYIPIILGLTGWGIAILSIGFNRPGLYDPPVNTDSFAGNPFPDPAGIQEVRFYYYHTFEDEEAEGVLSPLEIEALSLVFERSQKDPQPAAWQVLGVLDVLLLTKEKVQIELFSTGDSLGAFLIADQYYRGGSDTQFGKVLKQRVFQTSTENNSVE